MELVIDANIVISALIAPGGTTSELIFSEELSLYAPELLLDEFYKYKEEIVSKSKIEDDEFDLFLSIVASRIRFVPYSEFRQCVVQAKEISPDPNDSEYFAVALKKGCALWSNDKELQEQSIIKVYSTNELIKTLGLQ